jgi:antitoxin (DNA-binding transcriptional repressor) of toxin-antitoxin stability system
MYHMRKASIRDLRYRFSEVERLLQDGENIEITKRKRVIAHLLPVPSRAPRQCPDFLARLREIYGTTVLKVSGAELLARERSRY